MIVALIAAVTIAGISENDVLLINETNVPLARIQVDQKIYEAHDGKVTDKILLNVSPQKHHLKVTFRGGADVEWPQFDFNHVHEIIFERSHNKIHARIE